MKVRRYPLIIHVTRDDDGALRLASDDEYGPAAVFSIIRCGTDPFHLIWPARLEITSQQHVSFVVNNTVREAPCIIPPVVDWSLSIDDGHHHGSFEAVYHTDYTLRKAS